MSELIRSVEADFLRRKAAEVRIHALRNVTEAGIGHLGSEYSVIDILVALYFGVMNTSPELCENEDPARDRLILSKGHAANALYTTLAAAGIVTWAEVGSFCRAGSPFPGHPHANPRRGIDATTGALGHGLGIGVGMALAARLDGLPSRVFVVLGDGEMQEGSVWEALMFAAHRSLDNLTAIVDRNGLQHSNRLAEVNDVEPLVAKLHAFGWEATEVDGHDYDSLLAGLEKAIRCTDRPSAVVARTVKGFPVSFMRDQPAWHHRLPTDDEVRLAVGEISAGE